MSISNFPRRTAIGVAFAIVALATGAIVLRAHGPGNMWAGYLVGGTVTVVLILFALWRARRSPQTATTAERAVSPQADERDRAVRDQALAVLGAYSIPFAAAAAVAVALGVPAVPALAVLLWELLALLAVAFWRANRAM